MKKILSLVLAAAMVAVVAMSLTACGEKAPAPAPTETVAETAAETVAETAAEVVEETVAETVAEAPAGEAITVEFGDFEGQQAVSKDIQNGKCTDKAVEIEGISTKVGTHYSIGQKNDAGEFVGTTYEFDGEYPAGDAHVKLVGTVVTEGVVSKIIATSVEVVE